MVDLIVKDNIAEMTKWLDNIQRKQIPYATSRALNDTAVDAQKAIVDKIPSTFANRKKWWLKQQPTGIKVKFSKKTDLTATVHTSAYFAGIQERGGVKAPKSGRNLAIPTAQVPKKYRTSHGAKQMLAEKKKVFATPKGVFRRKSKKKIEVLWTFSPRASIKPRFKFHATAEATARRNFARNFERWLKQAIATAKPPSRK